MLRNLGEILCGAVQEGDPYMSLLQGTDIVGSITTHEGGKTLIFETEQNLFLLHWRNSGIYPSMAQKNRQRLLIAKLSKCVPSDADILVLQNVVVEVFGGVDRD